MLEQTPPSVCLSCHNGESHLIYLTSPAVGRHCVLPSPSQLPVHIVQVKPLSGSHDIFETLNVALLSPNKLLLHNKCAIIITILLGWWSYCWSNSCPNGIILRDMSWCAMHLSSHLQFNGLSCVLFPTTILFFGFADETQGLNAINIAHLGW